MTARRTTLLAGAALAGVLGLAGCFSTPAPQASTPASTPASEPSTEPSTEPEATEPEDDGSEPAPAGDVTPAGTTLTYGEAATVAWDPGDGEDIEQLMSITVTGVRPGAVADFQAAGLDEDFIAQIDDFQIFYVDIEATKLEPSSRDIASSSIYTDFGAVDGEGQSLQDVSIYGSFEPCDTSSFDDAADAGETLTTCIIVAANQGDTFGGATYEAYDSIYDDYDGQPIVWTE